MVIEYQFEFHMLLGKQTKKKKRIKRCGFSWDDVNVKLVIEQKDHKY